MFRKKRRREPEIARDKSIRRSSDFIIRWSCHSDCQSSFGTQPNIRVDHNQERSGFTWSVDPACFIYLLQIYDPIFIDFWLSKNITFLLHTRCSNSQQMYLQRLFYFGNLIITKFSGLVPFSSYSYWNLQVLFYFSHPSLILLSIVVTHVDIETLERLYLLSMRKKFIICVILCKYLQHKSIFFILFYYRHYIMHKINN